MTKVGDSFKFFDEGWMPLPLFVGGHYYILEFYTHCGKKFEYLWFERLFHSQNLEKHYEYVENLYNALSQKYQIKAVYALLKVYSDKVATTIVRNLICKAQVILWHTRDDVERANGYTEEELKERRKRNLKRLVLDNVYPRDATRYFYLTYKNMRA